jgi:hypothetical protein
MALAGNKLKTAILPQGGKLCKSVSDSASFSATGTASHSQWLRARSRARSAANEELAAELDAAGLDAALMVMCVAMMLYDVV